MKKNEFPINFSYPKSALVTLNVTDMNRAIKFYEEIFGFKISWNDARQLGWVEMTTHVQGLHIGLNESVHGVDSLKTAFTFNVSDLHETKKYLEEKGIKTTEIEEFAGMVAMFFFYDSEGNKLAVASASKQEEN